MFIRIKSLTTLALAVGLCLTQPAQAEEAPTAGMVMATVDGTKITLGHMIALRSSLPQQYDQIPAKTLFEGILDQLVQQTLLMQSHKAGEAQQIQLTIENERRALIAASVIESIMEIPITEDELQKAYEKQYVDSEQNNEYSAAHILVDTEEEAKALIEELHNGGDFAALAREHSTGPSGAEGGDLGWFSEGLMVEPFFNAVLALKAGEISPPVQSEFGWHVILLKEARSMDRPELGQVRAEIEEELRRVVFDDYIEKLTSAAQIDRPEIEGVDPGIINDLELLEN